MLRATTAAIVLLGLPCAAAVWLSQPGIGDKRGN
jgi:hypothetical protein